jgi:UDP-glucose:(heptosyl)LPS alpha-1,3-glucosyltransferase
LEANLEHRREQVIHMLSESVRSEERFEILQCVREIGVGGGVGGVAAHLERCFKDKGIVTHRLTMDEVGFRWMLAGSRIPTKVRTGAHVLFYSFAAPLSYAMRYRRNRSLVTISHNDALCGEIYVNHGVHKLAVRNSPHRWRMIVRNPLHLFLLIRERLRFFLMPHRTIVNFSSSGEEELRSAYPLNVDTAVIPNGVDKEVFQRSSEKGIAKRTELGLSANEFILMFVGHEFERKGLDLIVESLRLLEDSARLVVAGGTSRSIARATAKAHRLGVGQRVMFLGTVRELAPLYNMANVLVLPSSQEAWPLVLLEAMACGTPCLTTAVSSVGEFIDHSENGMIIERSAASIATAVMELRSNAELLHHMSEAASATAGRYSWDVIGDQYLRLVASIARAKAYP